MRRKEREVKEDSVIDQIIENCVCCRVGFIDKNEVYIVPLNFGFMHENQNRVFYFHGAKAGRKFELLKESPNVGFELDTNVILMENEDPSECTSKYQSIIGTGKISIIENKDEKYCALESLMKTSTKKEGWHFTDKMLDMACLFKLEVSTITCKQHQ